MKRKSNSEEGPHLTRGSVLDDLGFSSSEALEIKVKAELYRDLLKHINLRGFSQPQLGEVLGIHQPDVSCLLHGKVSRFSVGRLIQFAGRLNLGAQIKLTKPRTSKLPSQPVSVRPRRKLDVAP